MKKMLALLLALTMVLSLAACGKKDGGKENDGGNNVAVNNENFEKEKAEFAALTKEQIIAKYVKDPTAVTTDEYIALFSTVKYLDYAEDNGRLFLENNETRSAMSTLASNKAFTNVDYHTAFTTLIASEYPQIRGFVISNNYSLFVSKCPNEAKELLKKEKDPYVLSNICDSLSYENLTDSNVDEVEFIKKMSTNENKSIRASVAAGLIRFNKTSYNGILDMLLALINDSEQEVKEAALCSTGDFEDPKVFEAVEAVLKDKTQYEYHMEALYGLYKMWFDYPSQKKVSERAYKMTMEYYKTMLFDPEVKYAGSLSSINTAGSSISDEWKAKATYYNPSEITKLMVDVIVDPDIAGSAKYDAIRVMEAHSSKADFAANKAKVDSYTGDSADMLKERYQKAMDEAK